METIRIPEGYCLRKISDTEYSIERHLGPTSWKMFCEHNPVNRMEHYISSFGRILNALL